MWTWKRSLGMRSAEGERRDARRMHQATHKLVGRSTNMYDRAIQASQRSAAGLRNVQHERVGALPAGKRMWYGRSMGVVTSATGAPPRPKMSRRSEEC
jgi:hypothetical protein